jgi:hypothetical protein
MGGCRVYKIRVEGLFYFANFVNVWSFTHVFNYFKFLGWGLRENIKLAKGFECN